MAYAQVFKGAISEADAFCLFAVPDLVQGMTQSELQVISTDTSNS
jgi:hypothetical protein